MSHTRQQFQVIRGRPGAEGGPERPGLPELPKFEEALLTHLDSLFAFALRLVGGQRARAEDLLQEACLQAFQHYQSLRAPEKIKAWFFRILVHTHINEFHRRSRGPSIVDLELSEAWLEEAFVPSAPTPEERLCSQLLDCELQQALDALPVEFRLVVWLADVEELSYQEISEIINRPLGTVASRLYRGHSLLRERLQEFARRRGLLKE